MQSEPSPEGSLILIISQTLFDKLNSLLHRLDFTACDGHGLFACLSIIIS